MAINSEFVQVSQDPGRIKSKESTKAIVHVGCIGKTGLQG